jgi:hypothetical protein
LNVHCGHALFIAAVPLDILGFPFRLRRRRRR